MSDFHHIRHDYPTTTFIPYAHDNSGAGLNALTFWNEQAECYTHPFRNTGEAEELLLMQRPISTQDAFAIFGLLLGACVPAAIFYRMFNYGIEAHGLGNAFFPCLLWTMNVTCGMMGWKMGGVLGSRIDDYERASWHRMWVCSAGAGAVWGLATGGVGGALFFGVGSLFGALIALPVGIIGFALFTQLHRLMAHGGMIDARHLWPLACGVVLTITALILSPNI